ncbi:MAG: TetR/AcrR family transcriptional regulator [Pseudomonadota bacterium]
MSEKSDTRECILKAAMERISHYGYSKTTMSEIAKDCGMSAGNIYRFFASKVDIAEAMARKFNMEIHQDQAKIARKSAPAKDRLREIIEYEMETTFDKLDKDAKILEVAEVLSEERPLFANEELAQERIHLVKILEDGVAEGVFAPIADPAYTAEMIQTATMKFRYPQLFTRLTIEKLRREYNGVMDLVLAGLAQGVDARARTPETLSAE